MQNTNVNANGVSATGYETFGIARQHVFYVETSGRLEHRVFDGAYENTAMAFRALPPTGLTLTGRVAASWSYSSGGTLYVRCYATMTDGSLWVLRFNPATLSVWWKQLENPNTMSTSRPLAASASPQHDRTRVFASTTTGAIRTAYYDGDSWHYELIGMPSGNVSVGGTISAAEDAIDGYRSYVFCTKTGTADNRLFYAYATGKDGGYSWLSSLNLPAGEAVRNAGYAITSIARPDPFGRAIEVWVLNNDSTTTKLYHSQRVPGVGFTTPADLGQDGETGLKRGGLVATVTFPTLTYVFFDGRIGSTYRLYRRKGHESYPGTDPATWTNHQTGDPGHEVMGAGAPHAESMTAFYRGRVATVAQRTTTGILSKVELSWSTDDGDTWGPPQTVEFPMLGVVPERASDPVVDFSDDGTAHIVGLPIDDDNGCTAGINWQRSAHRAYDGNTFSTVTEIDVPGTQSDHPWIAVERIAGGDDDVHLVWGKDTPDTNRRPMYRRGRWNGSALDLDYDGDGQVDPAIDLDDPPGPNEPDTARPGAMISVGAQGALWVIWKEAYDPLPRFEVCLINAFRDNCEARLTLQPGQSAAVTDLDIPHSAANDALRCGNHYGIRASQEDPNILYYVYAKLEADGDQLDVFSSTITYDPGAGLQVGASVPLTNAPPDTDQLCPSVTSSRDGNGAEKVFASWYDRRDTCYGVQNSCFRIYHSVSFDQGISFLHTRPFGPVSDPTLLGKRCANSQYFLGDYHAVVGDLLHSAHVGVIAEVGSPADTSNLEAGWLSGGYYYYDYY